MSAASPPPLVLPDRYQLNEMLAAGGFGEVWRATDLALNRPVAVKLLHAGVARHPETLARFRAEARHCGALSHENIARVYDYGEPPDARAPFLVMELVEGPSLAEELAAGPLDPGRVADVVAQTAAGLDAAHRAGLVHRDIKPGNLMLSPDGLVKITDFGISYAAGAAPVTSTGQLVGTPGYLAPERVRGARAGPSSDLYSLGIVAWECLAGAAPFAGSAVEVAIAHRDRPLPPLPAFVPAEVAALVAELTAKDPAERPATAGDLARRAAGLHDRLAAGALPLGGDSRAAPAATIELPELPADLAGPAAGQPPAERPGRPWTGPGPAPGGRWTGSGPAPGGRWTGSGPAPVPRWTGSGRAPRRPRRTVIAAAALVAALAGLVAVGVVGVLGQLGPHRPATLSAGTQTPKAAAMVEVSARSLVGQPVREVAARLERLGLKVRVRWAATDAQRPGRVVSVQPGGRLSPGSVVTVTGALGPAARPSAASPASGRPGPGHHRPGRHGPDASAPASSAPPAQPTPSGSGSPGTTGPPAGTGSPAPPDSPAPSAAPPGTAPPGTAPATDAPR
ncbi:MAG TPA: protein kinase [Streptosporangiaceae bacterium]